MGRPKAGSTAVQLAMAGAREALLRDGVLVALTEDFPQIQHYVALMCMKQSHFPLYLLQHFACDPQRLRDIAQKSWDDMLRQVSATRPRVLFLSSEHLWNDHSNMDARSLADLLAPLSSDIEFVAYLRNPADRFLSEYQQKARGRGMRTAVQPMKERAVVEDCEAAFGQSISLASFDRAQLHGGDVVVDFVHRYLRPHLSAEVDIPARVENRSDSATSLAIGEEYWRWNYPGLHPVGPPDVVMLRTAIARIEQEDDCYRKPVLKPELRRQIIRASTELLWFRDERGLTFSGIDYDEIDGVCGDLIGRDDLDVADVMELDAETVSRVRALATRRLIDRARASEHRTAAPQPAAQPKPVAGPKRKAPWYIRRYRRLKKRGKALIDLTTGLRSG